MTIMIEKAPPALRLRVSDLSNFGDCRRQWKWYRKWAPPSETNYSGLITGELGHLGLELYYKTHRDWQGALDSYAQRSKLVAQRLYKEGSTPGVVEKSIKDAEGFIRHYFQFDQDVEQLAGAVIGVEQRLSFPIRHPETHEELPAVLSGKVDVILSTPRGDRIVDHKFLSNTTVARIRALDDVILIDSQLTGYAYLWWRKTGKVPSSVIFNFIFKNVPAPPTSIRKGTALSKDMSQSTTAALYRQAIRQMGLNEADYTEILIALEKQGYNAYFRRVEAARNLEELLSFERHLYYQAVDMLNVERSDDYAYPSGSLYRCGTCPFLQGCKSADDGGDYESHFAQWPRIDLEASL